MIMYTKMTEGPATEMPVPEPMDRPVPMAPQIAISWMWRLESPRSRWAAELFLLMLLPSSLVPMLRWRAMDDSRTDAADGGEALEW